MLRDEQYAIRALQAGAGGYLNKMSAADEIIKAIRSVSMGKRYLTSQVAEQMADNLQQHDNRQVHETLSPREFEIFTLLATGKFVTAIAQQLVLSNSSISTYRARVLLKMHLKNNADFIFYRIQHKLT